MSAVRTCGTPRGGRLSNIDLNAHPARNAGRFLCLIEANRIGDALHDFYPVAARVSAPCSSREFLRRAGLMLSMVPCHCASGYCPPSP